jgi:hypothetical protein
MNQNEYFMYHPDRVTRLIYADYLESRGDLFLASVLREENNVPITCDLRGEGYGWGSGDGCGFGCGCGWGYGNGGGYGSGNGNGYGDGFGNGEGRVM